MSSKTGKVVTELTENDVVIGRGAQSVGKDGRSRFREIVAGRRDEYLHTVKRKDKDLIARQVKFAVTSRQGRFLRKVESLVEAEQLGAPSGKAVYVVLDEDTILRKIKEALRNRDPEEPIPRESPVKGPRDVRITKDSNEERPQKKAREPVDAPFQVASLQSVREPSRLVTAIRGTSAVLQATGLPDTKQPTMVSTSNCFKRSWSPATWVPLTSRL